jgi:hypothetical protein
LFSSQFTNIDAGYTATDYVMKKLANRRDCMWLTATNADNIYGSDVVNRVLNAPLLPVSQKVPDLLLNPIDSRNFEWAGTYCTLYFTPIVYFRFYFTSDSTYA